MTEQAKTQRVLGVAEYEARWIARSFMVKLTAKGILPCYNYEAQLEMRPERVLPPMWNMVFFQEDYCLKARKFFEVEAIILNAEGATSISVTDATGEHQISIQEHLSPTINSEALRSAAEQDQYVVYAKLPKIGDVHHGCIIVPADFLVSAIHYRAFGPASKSECDTFFLKFCASEAKSLSTHAPGGEIPWPLLVEK